MWSSWESLSTRCSTTLPSWSQTLDALITSSKPDSEGWGLWDGWLGGGAFGGWGYMVGGVYEELETVALALRREEPLMGGACGGWSLRGWACEGVESVISGVYEGWGIWWMCSVRVGFLRGDYERVVPVVYKGWGIWWMCSVRVGFLRSRTCCIWGEFIRGMRLRGVGSLRDGRWGLGEGCLEGSAYGRWNLWEVCLLRGGACGMGSLEGGSYDLLWVDSCGCCLWSVGSGGGGSVGLGLLWRSLS